MSRKILSETRAIMARGYWILWTYEDDSAQIKYGVDPVFYFEEATWKYDDCDEADLEILPMVFKSFKNKEGIYRGTRELVLQDECMNIFHESQATHFELDLIREYKKTRRP
jgi:hypothetical protein